MSNPAPAASKADAILENLGLLAAAYNEPLSAERLKVYMMALSDLSPEELAHGFNRAIRELKFWPRPAELRELATGRAASMDDRLTTDQAWNWVQSYISLFGASLENRFEIQGEVFHGPRIDAAMGRKMVNLSTSAPFYEVKIWRVPSTPELVEQVLVAMSGTVKMGLERICDARRGWDSGGEKDLGSKDAAFVRRDFDEYCSRIIAARRVPAAAATINPAKQLTGDVRPELPPITPLSIAVHLEKDDQKYHARRFTLAEASTLYEAGILPQNLYEAEVRRGQTLEERGRFLNTPKMYNAVYLGVYEPAYSFTRTRVESDEDEPGPHLSELQIQLIPGCVPTGRFRIEEQDGYGVVHPDLPMAVGDMKLSKGQVVRFMVKPADLRFTERPRYCLDLNAAQMTTNKEKSHESK